MPEIIIWALVFSASLAVLIKSSDWFTTSAEKIGMNLGISPFIIGVTIVSVGTSLPELISSLVAIYTNNAEIVTGNVFGSNISNILLILGTAAVLAKEVKITHEIMHIDMPLLLTITGLLAFVSFDGEVNRPEAFLLLMAFAVYMGHAVQHKDEFVEAVDARPPTNQKETLLAILGLVLSSVLIFLGAHFTVESVVKISDLLQVGKEMVALSAVALGTSLPELAVTISAAKKKKPEMAVGNILGSNIFNSVIVMGIPAMLKPLPVPSSLLTIGMPLMITSTVLFAFSCLDRRISKWEGWMFLVFYLFFIGKTIGVF